MELVEGRIRLRPLRYSDKEVLVRLANNKKIWDNLRDMFPYPYQVSDAEKFIDMVKPIEPTLNFSIVYDTDFTGVIGIIRQHDVYRKSAEIGYWIGEPYWNMGIATIALKLATKYAFEELNLERLFAGVFEGNEESKRVLEKCAYQLEGIYRKAVLKNKKLIDEWRYAKLKGEYL